MIDWMPIVNRLRTSRGPLVKLAATIGVCPQHLRRLARGEVGEPKFTAGIQLLDMHSDDRPEHHAELRL